jgi:hypothetical protein
MSTPNPTPSQKVPNPFPGWRLKNGLMNAPDDQLEAAVESCERWALTCAGVLVVGVLAELALAAAHPPYDSFWEQWGSSLANLLVVLGVGGEVLFGRLGSGRQGELSKRAKKQLGEANERAAKAERETEKLRSKYAWRDLDPAQISRMAAVLRKKPSRITISYMGGDVESVHFATTRIATTFRLAGWTVQLEAGVYGSMLWFGVILPRPEDGADWRTQLIVAAFGEVPMGFNMASIPRWSSATFTQGLRVVGGGTPSTDEPTQLFVGPKQIIVE